MQPGASAPLAFVVATRNISAGGLSFLHDGFVHKGAVCRLRLVNRFGSWADVEGPWSAVDATVNEVSVMFRSPIEPSDICPEAATQRVLLAEDSLAMLRIAKHCPESFNTEVVHVPDGRQALELATEQEFDLVLMDMQMPLMGGYEAVSLLRQKELHGADHCPDPPRDGRRPTQVPRCRLRRVPDQADRDDPGALGARRSLPLSFTLHGS